MLEQFSRVADRARGKHATASGVSTSGRAPMAIPTNKVLVMRLQAPHRDARLDLVPQLYPYGRLLHPYDRLLRPYDRILHYVLRSLSMLDISKHLSSSIKSTATVKAVGRLLCNVVCCSSQGVLSKRTGWYCMVTLRLKG